MYSRSIGRTIATALLIAASGLAACRRGGAPSDDTVRVARAVPSDSAGGEVVQFALMKNSIGWLTDSNLVSLASIVNQAPLAVARIEAQLWTNEELRAFASEIIRDHAALQVSMDSLFAKRGIPSQRPAIADAMQAPYDSAVTAVAMMPLGDREPKFIDAVTALHARTIVDFGAIAGNATDPDLRALLSNRAILMEQAHVSKAKLVAASIAKADSIKRAETPARKR